MDKRFQKQEQVKQRIEEALFSLLKQKNFSEITITELINEAGVARASYYRNFDSKEDIIESYMKRQRKEVAQKIAFTEEITDLFIKEKLITSLEHYLKQKYYILMLCDRGFDSLILEEINQFAEMMLGDMPSFSTDRYKLYFLAGALFNMTIHWLRSGAMESPRELATVFLNLMNNGIESTFLN